MRKVYIIGDIGFSAIHLAHIAMQHHQIEIIHRTEELEKVMPLIDPFSNGRNLLKNTIIPEIELIQTRDSKGKLFEPVKSKYHK
jgi:N-acetyl-gamma-glutamylphosphate reductase